MQEECNLMTCKGIIVFTMCVSPLNCVTSILEQTSTFCDVLKEEKIDGVSVADDLFQSSPKLYTMLIYDKPPAAYC